MSWATLAARLLAMDPHGLGGVRLRGSGPDRDAALEALKAALPGCVRRLPVQLDEERLLGGLDLAATLARGAPVRRPGLLAEADGGVLVVGQAERLEGGTAARIAGVVDRGCVECEAGGACMEAPARFGVVLLDDGEGDERPPTALLERVALWTECDGAGPGVPLAKRQTVPGEVHVAEADLHALAGAAQAFGVASDRALVLTLRAARAHAALHGRTALAADDLEAAAALVLGPRATQLPVPADSPPPEAEPQTYAEAGTGEAEREPGELADRVVAAARAAMPADLIARLAEDVARGPAPRGRGAGERRRSLVRGRPAGVRPGLPRGGARLALIATLRAAAPWQRLRGCPPGGRVALRKDDLRVRRHVQRAEATTVFAVDASGSSAAARLAEAKGAVELMLGQAHVTRAEVALVAFRGAGAELLLPPTRSLTRARRALSDLPGGGGTPLAAGLDAARTVAAAAKAKGRTPALIVLTDGRANIAADGSPGRAQAAADAEAAARRIAAADVRGVVIDIAPRPDPAAARIAAAARLRYLALPRADAAALTAAIVP